jgi:hypothetical protein
MQRSHRRTHLTTKGNINLSAFRHHPRSTMRDPGRSTLLYTAQISTVSMAVQEGARRLGPRGTRLAGKRNSGRALVVAEQAAHACRGQRSSLTRVSKPLSRGRRQQVDRRKVVVRGGRRGGGPRRRLVIAARTSTPLDERGASAHYTTFEHHLEPSRVLCRAREDASDGAICACGGTVIGLLHDRHQVACARLGRWR